MFKLKRKAILVSSIVAPVLPIIAIVSCHHDKDKTATKEALNKEANGLKKGNFYYDDKDFDIQNQAPYYRSAEKISGSGLSKDTTLIATKVEADGGKLKITYTLENGDVSSNEQEFTYSGFKIGEVKGIKDVVSISKVIETSLAPIESSNRESILIATLTSLDGETSPILASSLTYNLVSVKLNGDSSSEHKLKFEWVGNKIHLKTSTELSAGTYEFIITSKVAKSDVTAIEKSFDVVVSNVKLVDVTFSSVSAVESSVTSDTEIGVIFANDHSNVLIDDSTYGLVSATQGDLDIKSKFKVTTNKLVLIGGNELIDGDVIFVVSVVKTSENPLKILSKELTIKISVVEEEIKDVVSISKVIETSLAPIESSNRESILIATLTSLDGETSPILASSLTYNLVSVKLNGDSSSEHKLKFEWVGDKINLKTSTELSAGTYEFIITSKVSESSATAIEERFDVVVSNVKLVDVTFGSVSAVESSVTSDTEIGVIFANDHSNVLIDDSTYGLVSATQSDLDIKSKFKVTTNKLVLIGGNELIDGDVIFVVSVVKTSENPLKILSKELTIKISIVEEEIKDVVSISKVIETSLAPIESSNRESILIATLTSLDGETSPILASSLTYNLVSVKLNGDSSSEHKLKFEWVGDKINLKTSTELSAGTYEFIITSKVSESSATAIEERFDVVVSNVKLVDVTFGSVSAVESSVTSDTEIGVIFANDHSNVLIDDSTYGLVSATQSDLDIKSKFKVTTNKLVLIGGNELIDGDVIFVVSVVKTSENPLKILSKELTIKISIVEEEIKDVVSISKVIETSLASIESSNRESILIATLTSLDGETSPILASSLTYNLVSVKLNGDSSSEHKLKFEWVGDKINLKTSTELSAGTYEFIITSKVSESSATAIEERFDVIIS